MKDFNKNFYLELFTLEPGIKNTLIYRIDNVIRYGNLELASFLMEVALEKQGHGFNKFHLLALTAKTSEELKEMRLVNTRKKPYSSSKITPFHCACINPNPEVLNYFLELNPEMYIVDEK